MPFAKFDQIQCIPVTVEPTPYPVWVRRQIPSGRGIVFPETVLKPQVYEFVQRQFEGRDIPDYLYQFSPDEVQVNWEDQSGLLRINVTP